MKTHLPKAWLNLFIENKLMKYLILNENFMEKYLSDDQLWLLKRPTEKK